MSMDGQWMDDKLHGLCKAVSKNSGEQVWINYRQGRPTGPNGVYVPADGATMTEFNLSDWGVDQPTPF